MNIDRNSGQDRAIRQDLRNLEAIVKDLRAVLNAPGSAPVDQHVPGTASIAGIEGWNVDRWRHELLSELSGSTAAVIEMVEGGTP